MIADRPRRSCLYIPGSNERALSKAKSLPTDVLIFDLEDGVAPESKIQARANIFGIMGAGGFGKRELIIRINDLDSEWGQQDISQAILAKADGILVPKISTNQDIFAVDAAMEGAGAGPDVALWIMIETPLAILNLAELAAAKKETRLKALVIGINDLVKESHAILTPDRSAFQSALSQTIFAARAYDLIAIDGVYNDFRNEAGFEAECEQGRLFGFDGKSLIHPNQIATANRVFAPKDEELKKANTIIEAFSAAENQDKGVIAINGNMTERLHLEQAKKLVALQAKITGFSD